MERKQFTFYASFYKSISRIRRKAERCDAYDAIVKYALTGEEPGPLTERAAMVFELVRPILDSARLKAEAGRIGGSVPPRRISSL